MANVLLVVVSTTLSANDQAVSNQLTGDGHTVTTQVSTTALPNTGYDVCVITESGSSSSAAIVSIPTCALPVVLMETSWERADLSTVAATASAGAGQALDVIVPAHPIMAGVPDPVTVHGSGVNMYGAASGTTPAGVLDLAEHSTVAGHTVVAAADAGAALDGTTAPARRVALGHLVASNSITNQTADGWLIFRNAVNWAAGIGGGPTSLSGLVLEDGSGFLLLEDGGMLGLE